MGKKYSIAVALLMMIVLLISACSNLNTDDSGDYDRYTCYDTMIDYARENLTDNIDIEQLFSTYCGNEKYDNAEIIANDGGYKDTIIFMDGGIVYRMVYYPDLRSVMEWITNNTPKNAKIASWWDYGGMIKGFTGRIPVVMNPSKGTLKYLAIQNSSSPNYPKKFESDETMEKIAIILATDNPQEATKLMKELNAKYLLVPIGIDINKFPVIYDFAYGKFKSIENGWNNPDAALEEGDVDTKSITYKVFTNQSIPGFRKVYSDENAVILEVQ